MDFLDLREPVSAWSHGAGLLLSMPITIGLLRGSSKDPYKRLSFLVFGLSLAACYGSSALFHGSHAVGEHLQVLRLMDQMAIFALIAGTYTPIAWNLLRGRWRRTTLVLAWLTAALGASLHLACPTLSPWVSTSLYLAMGWGAAFSYAELAKTWPHRRLRLILVGGVLYSIGAAINLMHWPNLWPDVFGFHELFHLFVIAGTGAHVWFMATVVVPAPAPEAWASAAGPRMPAWPAPHWFSGRLKLAPLLIRPGEVAPRALGAPGRRAELLGKFLSPRFRREPKQQQPSDE
jgi:hemolysin III